MSFNAQKLLREILIIIWEKSGGRTIVLGIMYNTICYNENFFLHLQCNNTNVSLIIIISNSLIIIKKYFKFLNLTVPHKCFRDSVTKYLMRLREIEDTDPTLLMAYIYHLYMGLLSGGIILRKKRQLMQKISPFKASPLNDGNNVTDFGQNSIFQLKSDLRESMNRIAETLDEDTKNKLIEESKIVFELNNEIVKSVQTGNHVFEKVLYFIGQIVLILCILIIVLNILFKYIIR